MFAKQYLIFKFLFHISMQVIKCDQICESIVPDGITRLQNGSIVVFQKKEVWIFDTLERQLSGPCPINELFEDMSGPIDAAVTFDNHESVTEFLGASIYFGEGNFHTFKNMRPYQVEWGALIYLPVNGKQANMGASVEAKRLMSQTMSAAYFDPIGLRSKFIFSDGSVLAFNFELGSEYDTPVVSTLDQEFKKYGIVELPKEISAALTLTVDKKSKVFLFEGSKYCGIQIDNKNTNQSCDLKPVSQFFDCNNLKPIKNLCGAQGIQGRFPATHENPIQVQTQPEKQELTVPSVSPEVKQTIRVRDDSKSQDTTNPSPKSDANPLFYKYVFAELIQFLLFSLFI